MLVRARGSAEGYAYLYTPLRDALDAAKATKAGAVGGRLAKVNVYGVVVGSSLGEVVTGEPNEATQPHSRVVLIHLRDHQAHLNVRFSGASLPPLLPAGSLVRVHRASPGRLWGGAQEPVLFAQLNVAGCHCVAWEPTKLTKEGRLFSSSANFTFNDGDLQRLKALSEVSMRQERFAESMVFSDEPPERFDRLSALVPRAYKDLQVEVLGVAMLKSQAAVLRVWDGTECSLELGRVSAWAEEVDEELIAARLDEQRLDKVTSLGQRMVADVFLYDEWVPLVEELRPGDVVRLVNLHVHFRAIAPPAFSPNKDKKVWVSCALTMHGRTSTAYERSLTKVPDDDEALGPFRRRLHDKLPELQPEAAAVTEAGPSSAEASGTTAGRTEPSGPGSTNLSSDTSLQDAMLLEKAARDVESFEARRTKSEAAAGAQRRQNLTEKRRLRRRSAKGEGSPPLPLEGSSLASPAKSPKAKAAEAPTTSPRRSPRHLAQASKDSASSTASSYSSAKDTTPANQASEGSGQSSQEVWESQPFLLPGSQGSAAGQTIREEDDDDGVDIRRLTPFQEDDEVEVRMARATSSMTSEKGEEDPGGEGDAVTPQASPAKTSADASPKWPPAKAFRSSARLAVQMERLSGSAVRRHGGPSPAASPSVSPAQPPKAKASSEVAAQRTGAPEQPQPLPAPPQAAQKRSSGASPGSPAKKSREEGTAQASPRRSSRKVPVVVAEAVVEDVTEAVEAESQLPPSENGFQPLATSSLLPASQKDQPHASHQRPPRSPLRCRATIP